MEILVDISQNTIFKKKQWKYYHIFKYKISKKCPDDNQRIFKSPYDAGVFIYFSSLDSKKNDFTFLKIENKIKLICLWIRSFLFVNCINDIK